MMMWCMMGGFVVSMQTHYTASPAQYADQKYTELIAPSNNSVRKICVMRPVKLGILTRQANIAFTLT